MKEELEEIKNEALSCKKCPLYRTRTYPVVGEGDHQITEASFYRKGGLGREDKQTREVYGHTGIPNLINLFKKFTSYILFLHFGSWFYRDIKQARRKLNKLGKENKIKITVAYQGLELLI